MIRLFKKIKTMEQLKNESIEGGDFFIRLRSHLISRKRISWDDENRVFEVFNYIDETDQVLTEEQIMDRDYTNIGYAIQKGALFKEDI